MNARVRKCKCKLKITKMDITELFSHLLRTSFRKCMHEVFSIKSVLRYFAANWILVFYR